MGSEMCIRDSTKGEADINQCPPGGEEGIKNIAKLLEVDFKPLNKKHGITKPISVALIDEEACIGCTLCILACPVDAILGATKKMHTIIEDECTGCELCLNPCPVDCIEMLPIKEGNGNQIISRRKSNQARSCLLYTSPSPRDGLLSRMPSSA